MRLAFNRRCHVNVSFARFVTNTGHFFIGGDRFVCRDSDSKCQSEISDPFVLKRSQSLHIYNLSSRQIFQCIIVTQFFRDMFM